MLFDGEFDQNGESLVSTDCIILFLDIHLLSCVDDLCYMLLEHNLFLNTPNNLHQASHMDCIAENDLLRPIRIVNV